VAAPRATISVMIRGKEFRVRGEESEESLRKVAHTLEEAMDLVEERTGTVDSLDIALLTGLNLARELVRTREGRAPGQAGAPTERLRALTDRVEAELAAGEAGA
jgi:cell division protein ZapA (FtsZ GTPase activity inhibitor)